MMDFPASYVGLQECKIVSPFVLRISSLISVGLHVGLIDPAAISRQVADDPQKYTPEN